MTPGFEAGLVIPDLWQQEAVRALQQEKDVVVQAPTGSGKTYIFELLYPNRSRPASNTQPRRAMHRKRLTIEPPRPSLARLNALLTRAHTPRGDIQPSQHDPCIISGL